MDLNTELTRLHEEVRVTALVQRKFDPDDFWEAVLPRIDGPGQIEVEEVGRSALGRPLRLVRFGSGATRVLIWSQMHGDEPTGTMALADLFRLLAERADDERVRRWAEDLTLLIVPILNPDGAARFQRRNAQGIDMNRDARTRYSPELRTLFELHEKREPNFAIELHDEDTKTRVGKTALMTGASLIAPTFDAAKGDNETRLAAKRLCVVISKAIQPLLGEHIARYAEHYLPGSIGTALQAKSTPTVLFETGWWPMDPELQFLRKMNFVGLVAALDALATGGYAQIDLADYDAIPRNDRNVFDLLILGGTLILPGTEPYRADVGINFEVSLDLQNGHIADIGDLADYSGRDIIVAEGMFIHPESEALAEGSDGGAYLETKRPASFTIRVGAEPTSKAVYTVRAGIARRADEP